MLDEIMEFCVVRPERTLMIGDSSYDLQMAENAGAQAAAVTFGAQKREKLLGYNSIEIFDAFNDLSTWLLTKE
jgi:phosphoglycolate phosphatase